MILNRKATIFGEFQMGQKSLKVEKGNKKVEGGGRITLYIVPYIPYMSHVYRYIVKSFLKLIMKKMNNFCVCSS